MKHYAHRDIGELDRAGGYYCRHVRAMSEEGLSSKSDIAAELAFRDHKIAQLEAMLDEKLDPFERQLMKLEEQFREVGEDIQRERDAWRTLKDS